jgi:hypothetical protein
LLLVIFKTVNVEHHDVVLFSLQIGSAASSSTLGSTPCKSAMLRDPSKGLSDADGEPSSRHDAIAASAAILASRIGSIQGGAIKLKLIEG